MFRMHGGGADGYASSGGQKSIKGLRNQKEARWGEGGHHLVIMVKSLNTVGQGTRAEGVGGGMRGGGGRRVAAWGR